MPILNKDKVRKIVFKGKFKDHKLQMEFSPYMSAF